MKDAVWMEKANALFDSLKENFVGEDYALSPDLIGLQLFDAPLFGVADAHDPIFEEFLKPEVIGPDLLLPDQWLSGAQRVVAFFLPFTERVRKENRQDMSYPATEWLHGRIEGQIAINAYLKKLCDLCQDEGYRAAAPTIDDRFRSSKPKEGGHNYTSNWSERHAAYAAGLGTFSMSRGLITKKGVAGRFGSLITDMPLVVTPRPYTDRYEYCNRCGVCAVNCPVDAIDPSKPRDITKTHLPCSTFIDTFKDRSDLKEDLRPPDQRDDYRPAIHRMRYGCGKCQVQTPCETCAPGRAGCK